MSIEMSIDCRTYSSESCKKGENMVFDSFTEIIVLACWGVYCQGGDYIYYSLRGIGMGVFDIEIR
jgi:hypothetical protein